MGKGSSSAPNPDPKIGEAALKQAETGEAWLKFAGEAWAESQNRQADLDELTRRVTEQHLDIQDTQFANAKKDRARYEEKHLPLEDEFIEEARNYGSEERQAAAAAEAKADVERAAADRTAAVNRTNAALGINPASGRHQGIKRAAARDTALASAGAQNQARTRQRDVGLGLKADAVNIGRGLPAQAAGAASLGLTAGAGAVGMNQGANAQYIGSTGIMGAGFGGAQSGYANQAGILNDQYRGQLSAWQTQQSVNAQNAAGIGKVAGTIIGSLPFMSDEDVKEDKQPLEDGAALEAVKDMPVENWKYKEGVEDSGKHVGPYAQDFARATGIGDGATINPQDAIGITMAAVQDLDKKVDRIADAVGKKRPKKQAALPGIGASKFEAKGIM